MNTLQQRILFLLRIAMGWFFFYAGITKVLDSTWSAASYLENAQTFSGLFHFFLQPSLLPWVNILNSWGLTLVGVALMAGCFVRFASSAGIMLMALYYLPILDFPFVGGRNFLVDQHVLYTLSLAVLAVFNAGKYIGVDALRARGR